MDYQVVLEEFQGPLDLLLHLIKEKEMDLENLEVFRICDQYLAYIQEMRDKNLNILSEYLVMAANLLEMKSKMLIPRVEVDIAGDYQEDPREALIRRLIEYKRYKDVLDDIKSKYESRQTMIVKPSSNMEEFVVDTSTMIPEGLDVYSLIRAMKKMYQRIELSKPLETHIARVDISIDDRCEEIKDYFHRIANRKVGFLDLLEDNPSKTNFIVTFLAILVLCKDQEVLISQDELHEDIFVEGVL